MRACNAYRIDIVERSSGSLPGAPVGTGPGRTSPTTRRGRVIRTADDACVSVVGSPVGDPHGEIDLARRDLDVLDVDEFEQRWVIDLSE